MSEEPLRAVHPTIYHVVLEPAAQAKFDASPALRASMIADWSYKAQQAGKRSLEVHGRYTRLLQLELPKEGR